MIPLHLLPLRVTWQHPGVATDDDGNEQPDWTDGARTDVEDLPGYLEQRSTAELVDGRSTVVTRPFFITNELEIAAEDRIVDGDKTYEVDGDPAILLTPSGPHHAEMALLRVSG